MEYTSFLKSLSDILIQDLVHGRVKNILNVCKVNTCMST
jgi:hypothetical protein